MIYTKKKTLKNRNPSVSHTYFMLADHRYYSVSQSVILLPNLKKEFGLVDGLRTHTLHLDTRSVRSSPFFSINVCGSCFSNMLNRSTVVSQKLNLSEKK